MAYWLARKEYGEHLLQKGKFKVNANAAWKKWEKGTHKNLVGESTFRGWFNKEHPFKLKEKKKIILWEDLYYLKLLEDFNADDYKN